MHTYKSHTHTPARRTRIYKKVILNYVNLFRYSLQKIIKMSEEDCLLKTWLGINLLCCCDNVYLNISNGFHLAGPSRDDTYNVF